MSKKDRFSKKNKKKIKSHVGLPPGSLVYTGDLSDTPIHLTRFIYNEANLTIEEGSQLFQTSDYQCMTWLKVEGIHEVNLIKSIGDTYKLHSMTLEDIVNPYHRAKVEEHPDYLFCALKILAYNPDKPLNLDIEHVSLILKGNSVISFQEKPNSIFQSVIDELKKDKSKVRRYKAEYLFYLLLDLVIDQYVHLIDKFGDRLLELELELDMTNQKTSVALEKITEIRSEIIFLQKSIGPIKEIASAILKSKAAFFSENMRVYIRDMYDHATYIYENIHYNNSKTAELLSHFISLNSYHMNETVKSLTIITTIFMPLTFLASLYGMNFKYLPGSDHPYGFFINIAIMAASILIMAFILRRKRWM